MKFLIASFQVVAIFAQIPRDNVNWFSSKDGRSTNNNVNIHQAFPLKLTPSSSDANLHSTNTVQFRLSHVSGHGGSGTEDSQHFPVNELTQISVIYDDNSNAQEHVDSLKYNSNKFLPNSDLNRGKTNEILNVPSWRNNVAKSNMQYEHEQVSDSVKTKYIPGTPAPEFTLPTLNGELKYPGSIINRTTPIIFHSFNPNSGFLECLWNCSGTIKEFVTESSNDAHYIFMSNSLNALMNALWMRNQLFNSSQTYLKSPSSLLNRLHFVTVSLDELGNWIPELLWQWSCPDHSCGLDQISIESPSIWAKFRAPLVLKRLDARYDWLPSPTAIFGTKSVPLFSLFTGSKGCTPETIPKGAVVVVPEDGCSYFNKIQAMQASGAAGVIIAQTDSAVVQDMNCEGQQCTQALAVPASMVPDMDIFRNLQNATIKYQNTPSENFFFAIDHQGSLAEVGWFLYPTFRFLSWQSQWFTFKQKLSNHLSEQTDVMEIVIFNNTVMEGKKGAVSTVKLPPIEVLRQYRDIELDTHLSCPGTLDQDCPHWDHTVQFYICCNVTSPLCGMELGRWISPFRRRIGHWVTPIRSLLPLLSSSMCQFTMKTVPWAMTWKPSLALRLSGKYQDGDQYLYPYDILPLYLPQFTFDKKYNSHFKEKTFTLPSGTRKVELVSVITGHGSDENGCGEFCVTSHHFVVNGYSFNRTFDIAGSPFGCADNVLQGVEPNEHGTWLYGRDGWCDGQQVEPWVIDLSSKVKVTGSNSLSYYGWFNGTDPDPAKNPGIMIFYSYLTFYKES